MTACLPVCVAVGVLQAGGEAESSVDLRLKGLPVDLSGRSSRSSVRQLPSDAILLLLEEIDRYSAGQVRLQKVPPSRFKIGDPLPLAASHAVGTARPRLDDPVQQLVTSEAARWCSGPLVWFMRSTAQVRLRLLHRGCGGTMPVWLSRTCIAACDTPKRRARLAALVAPGPGSLEGRARHEQTAGEVVADLFDPRGTLGGRHAPDAARHHPHSPMKVRSDCPELGMVTLRSPVLHLVVDPRRVQRGLG